MQLRLFSAPEPTPVLAAEGNAARKMFEADDPDGARWYQREAYESILRELEAHRSTLVVQATGLGKTFLFCMVAKSWPGNVLVLAHRDELLQQTVSRLERMTGEQVELEQAVLRASRHCRLVVGSVQTMCKERRLQRFAQDHFSLIIVDEVHHVTAKSYTTILEYFATAKVVGFTATPDRSDGKALAQVLEDSVAHVFDIWDGIEAGFLVPISVTQVSLQEIDISHVRKSKGEGGLNLGELDDAMVKAVEGIVAKVVELEPDRRAICFFPGVRSAEYACERFNAVRPGSACFISGETPTDERRQLIRDFKDGKYRYLCNCAVATEGFDAPPADMIVLGRPTLSRSLCAQMIGRGTRVLDGVINDFPAKVEAKIRRELIAESEKPNMVVMDFVGNVGSHTLVTPVDVLGGTFTTEEVAKAKEKVAANPRKDVQEALVESRAEIKALRELARSVTSKVTASVKTFDPFSVFHVDRKQVNKYEQTFGWVPATEAQRSQLRNVGLSDEQLKDLSKHAASKLISTVIMRRKKGLANFKQLKLLKKHGVDDLNVGFAAASRGIDFIKQHNWKDVPVEGLRRVMGLKPCPATAKSAATTANP